MSLVSNKLRKEEKNNMGIELKYIHKKLRLMEGVNSTLIHCKNFCKCHIVPPVQ
jgi:hypothetical protein